MTMLQRSLSWFVISATAIVPGLGNPAPSQAADDDAAAAAKADEWLKAMTLEEKIGQMTQADLKAVKDKADIARYGLGSMLSGGDSDPDDISAKGWARTHDELQSWALKSRLKIPLIYGIDAVHGHNNVDGAVVFPHNIGLGATRDPGLVEKACADHGPRGGRHGHPLGVRPVRGRGPRRALGPDVRELRRDARAGRGRWAPRPSAGCKAPRLADPTSVLACAKHYLGDGGTTGGMDQGNTECDEATLRKIHLPGYVAAIKAGVGSVMVSYSSWNGAKMHGHRYLLTDLLKGELGFKGFVVSDWAAIDQLSDDYKTAIEKSINAGIDMVMIPNGPGKPNNYVEFITKLKELVDEGKVPQSRIDDAVRRILLVKARMKLADHPFTDPALTAAVGSAEHRQVARECVRKSLVLLKNEKHALPLSKQVKRLVVAGPAADDLGIQCGGWTIDWQGKTGEVTRGGTTILAAIRQAVGPTPRSSTPPTAPVAAGADAWSSSSASVPTPR